MQTTVGVQEDPIQSYSTVILTACFTCLGIGVGEGGEGDGQGHTDQCGPDLTPYKSQCQSGGHPNRGEGVTVCVALSPDLFRFCIDGNPAL